MSASLSSHASALSGTYTPTPLQIVNYGPGSISTLPELVHKLAAPSSDSKAKVLIVTGNSLADKTGVITDIQAILEKEGIASIVFKGIGQHARKLGGRETRERDEGGGTPADISFVLLLSSAIAGIRDAVKIVTEKRCTVLVSVGGGSPIDAAKVSRRRVLVCVPTFLQLTIHLLLPRPSPTLSRRRLRALPSCPRLPSLRRSRLLSLQRTQVGSSRPSLALYSLFLTRLFLRTRPHRLLE